MLKTLTSLDVRPVRAFADNYIWLIESPRVPGRVVAVDPGDAAPVRAELRRSGASLAAILLTHHHPDHIGGVEELLELGPVPVVGPEDARIALRNRTVRDGERCDLPDLGLCFEILAVPGHTLSHIAFWGHGALFCGDTLFSAGCGRMFEGTPIQMNASLNRLRAAGAPTLPSPLSLEIRINPFLRCDIAAVRASAEAHAGKPLPAAADVFTVLRSWKDSYR